MYLSMYLSIRLSFLLSSRGSVVDNAVDSTTVVDSTANVVGIGLIKIF